ncbi:hypothetical protein OCU04_002894 [Sclerotinia nivalis]|uniref:Uncharacterized protein n=1 Tax=Sclerotinia nivalis TaxID=352851 RepID=A0A9X0DQL8_9HELO|nr:hypothetical protein OCU04_002894 [Sclerotinia nivalis]
MNFLGSLFNSLRRAIATLFSDNFVNDRSSPSAFPTLRPNAPIISEQAENAVRRSPRRKDSQIIAAPNDEQIHFSHRTNLFRIGM